MSVERTFNDNLTGLLRWQSALPELEQQPQQRLSRLDQHYLVSGLFIKVKYEDFTSATCETPSTRADNEVFANLLQSQWQRRPGAIRLLGIGLRLKDVLLSHQQDLFPEATLAALALQRAGRP